MGDCTPLPDRLQGGRNALELELDLNLTWLLTFDLAFDLQAALSSAEVRLISSMSRQDVGERAC
ncbi:hypothetical protein [Erwinia piriflorinigrans]|uniref:Uncharacterized protein n=1 Tax=Erwinia piriflorinigrans CFBP 5888 TaxID=1161919 RepID=V5Z467_9GAMM|nr:hypothetical protein [Erwinia piriflorinigrans]CCG85758.1 hypothetical protein EPIR_0393 [Erwinia piriflorinigrans CFBP 5888]